MFIPAVIAKNRDASINNKNIDKMTSKQYIYGYCKLFYFLKIFYILF